MEMLYCNPIREIWELRSHEHRQVVLLFTETPHEPMHIQCELGGEGASVDIIGIFLLEGSAALKLDLNVVHSAPATKSTITMVSVLQGNASQDIEGRIAIHKGAKGADGFLSHRTLTLSADAKSISVPILEIEEDDVKAGHAGVSGPVDPEQMFYLQTRGIPQEQCEKVMVEGFLEQVIKKIKDEAIQEKVKQFLGCHSERSEESLKAA